MNAATLTLEEIRRQGIEALTRALGLVGMIRFLQPFDLGTGDYSRERHGWLIEDLSTIAEGLRREDRAADRP